MSDDGESPADGTGGEPGAATPDARRPGWFLRESTGGALSPRRAGLQELADATRLLINRLVGTDAPDDVVAAATRDVQAAADRFLGYHEGSVYSFAESANSGGQLEPILDHSPLIGIANALAPPMRVSLEDSVIVGRVVFGAAYEGPPGCVHGGYVAAAFDELLGSAQSLSGAPGMTGTLSVRYESPTPLHTDLRLEGRLVRVEGRKNFTEGLMFAGDRLTARSEGLFISMRPGRMESLLRERPAVRSDDEPGVDD